MKLSFIFLLTIGLGVYACATSAVTSHRVKINDEEMLIGIVSRDELFTEFPIFRERYDEYTADSARVDSLRSLTRPIHIDVVLGTWCGDSKRNLAHFLKVLDAASNQHLTWTLICVDRTKRDREAVAAKYRITRVPTFVFIEKDHEIGRIVESPMGTMEEDLCAILKP
jgi:hypothetical protein